MNHVTRDQDGRSAPRPRTRWAALAVLIALFATTVFTATPAAQAQFNPGLIQLDAFAVNGTGFECYDPWSAFLNGEPAPDPTLVLGEQSLVSHCFIVTNNGPEAISVVGIETYPARDVFQWRDIDDDPVTGELHPGDSALFLHDGDDRFFDNLAELGVSQLAATVTWAHLDGRSGGQRTAYVAVDGRRVTVSTGDYTAEAGDVVEVVLDVDASEIPVATVLTELTYDPAVLQPLRDDDGNVMCLLREAAGDSFCEELNDTTLDVRATAEGGPTESWTGPTSVISIAFVAVGQGTSALDLEQAWVQRPGFRFWDSFGAFIVDGSVTVTPASEPPVLSISNAAIDEVDVAAPIGVSISPGAGRWAVSDIEFRLAFDSSVIQPALGENSTPICEGSPGVVVVCEPISQDNFIDVTAYATEPGGWYERGLFSISFLPVGDSGESPLTIESGQAVLVNGAATHLDVQNGSLAVDIEADEPVVMCLGEPVTINMQAGDPGLGTDGPDVILGTNGADTIWARGGDDIVCGGGGDDVIGGGAGDDLIDGGFGADRLLGHDGNDELLGGNSNDVLIGGPGNDVLTGGLGADDLRGHAGRDTLRGGGGDDNLIGGADNDLIIGGWGNDALSGGGGADRLFGSRGVDTLLGGSGDDVLKGDDDVDTCTGGPGTDVFEACEDAS